MELPFTERRGLEEGVGCEKGWIRSSLANVSSFSCLGTQRCCISDGIDKSMRHAYISALLS